MFLEGQHSGINYNMRSCRGVAQYTVDAFEAACQIAHEHCYEDIFSISSNDMYDKFCPDFILDDEGIVLDRAMLMACIETEIKKLQERILGSGGCLMEISDYDGRPVDESLLEKALDFMISLEPDPESPAAVKDYELALEANKDAVQKAKAIMRMYGRQITPLSLERIQEVFYDITDSGKYSSTRINCSVARACLTDAWHGIGDWRK